MFEWLIFRLGARPKPTSTASCAARIGPPNATWRNAVCIGALLTMHLQAMAQTPIPGTLDGSWATVNGAAQALFVDMGSTAGSSGAIAMQSDGRAVVAMDCSISGQASFCVGRVTDTGRIDADWGSGQSGLIASGRLAASFGTARTLVTGVVIQRDGKIVIGGECANGGGAAYCAVRYFSNGRIDTSFGNQSPKNGRFLGAFTAKWVTGFFQTFNGQFVFPGSCVVGNGSNVCLYRLTADGDTDVNFGTNGFVLNGAAGGLSYAGAALEQANGQLLVASPCRRTSGNTVLNEACVVRLNADGSTDTSYQGTGFATVRLAGTSLIPNSNTNVVTVNAIARYPDGRVVVGGTCVTGSTVWGCVARVAADGAWDFSFASSGRTTSVGRGGATSTTALQVLPDGRLLVAGNCDPAENAGASGTCIRQYHDGGLDRDFGPNFNGVVIGMHSSTATSAVGFARARDGKFLVASVCQPGGLINRGICVSRHFGGPQAALACSLDLDGDQSLGDSDVTLLSRLGMGLTGPRLFDNVPLSPAATRRDWPSLRAYLNTQCQLSF